MGREGKVAWLRWSLVSQITLFLYYQLIEWVSIFPWNDIRRGNGQETLDLVVAGIMSVLILVTFLRLWWAMFPAVLLYAFWLWLQVDSWWVPYVKGASAVWQKVYEANFAATFRFLPSTPNHLAPDACHTVMQLLILGAIVTTTVAAFHIRAGRR